MDERKSQHSIAPLIDGELLVAQSEDLELQGGSRSRPARRDATRARKTAFTRTGSYPASLCQAQAAAASLRFAKLP
ncbi:MAG TPA: hypothetical protein VMK12_18940 [Anaeromyxobacteraceae bacterium]|nr:hypothetical protein [Anaeromyxobacteraceae bacterium]